ncbi:MAG: CopG family antitoxin [Pseudomonadota bacterium]
MLPENFETIEEFFCFWDTHSSADYEELMETVEVEIDLISSKTYCAISKELLSRVRTQAHRQGLSSETLINIWLQEKLLTTA